MSRRTSYFLPPTSYVSQGGIVLIESIIAISIATVGLLALFSLLTRSLGLQRVVAERYIAAALAGEGIELVKNLVSTNFVRGAAWNDGLPTSAGEYEMDYNDVALTPRGSRPLRFDGAMYGYDAGNPTAFYRTITVTPVGSPIEEIGVRSNVSWTSRGGLTGTVDVEDHFFNWRCTPGIPGCD
ncbi:MAG: hypothetical protein HYT82_00415 [Candidatus Harrisonbacteria bacterium]|nr:hypothetical protein [Candidatus Harrisonbacteria bacterium]MBI2406063.1 hypothetical protein [Candidatus Harrisonbacteria bacterium]